jgi:hypothetical protein
MSPYGAAAYAFLVAGAEKLEIYLGTRISNFRC